MLAQFSLPASTFVSCMWTNTFKRVPRCALTTKASGGQAVREIKKAVRASDACQWGPSRAKTQSPWKSAHDDGVRGLPGMSGGGA